jgi:hypothetical protein
VGYCGKDTSEEHGGSRYLIDFYLRDHHIFCSLVSIHTYHTNGESSSFYSWKDVKSQLGHIDLLPSYIFPTATAIARASGNWFVLSEMLERGRAVELALCALRFEYWFRRRI